jgi:RND family efflux transporter MFP subunit
MTKRRGSGCARLISSAIAGLTLALVADLCSCTGADGARAKENGAPGVTVGVTKVARMNLKRTLTLSSELVPFQEIDVYAKESGYVKNLYVDYGTRVKEGQLMAVLEIPELEAQLKEDEGDIKNWMNQINRAKNEVKRYQAMYTALHLEYTRLKSVSESQPGLVAQQEVDDAQGKDLSAASQVDAAEANLDAVQGQLAGAQARLAHDQALYSYARITAPFAGVVTQRYANLGALMQSGTGSSTQAMPLVRLSQDDLFRLTIPVPESYVRFIRVADPVDVRVPSLDRHFPGKVARFSVDVREDTRTMHTEVDVPNPNRVMMPGVYAEATLTLEQRANVLAVPLQAVDRAAQSTVLILDSGDTIEERTVTLGVETSNTVEVLSGLAEGDQVVVSDRSGLKPGEKVQPKPVQVLEYREQDPSGGS